VNRALMKTGAWVALLLMLSVAAQAQIYKQVDENGNVTYTDQVPPDGSAPMVLPDLPVIATDTPPEAAEEIESSPPNASQPDSEPTPRDLRRMYRDFRILRPVEEETFWGTENMVVVSWGGSTPLRENMSVALFVDGQRQQTGDDDMTALRLDRGQHQVYAQLLDARGRRIVTTATVTFFVKQYSAQFNQPSVTPNSGN